jgi:hypothetical protein
MKIDNTALSRKLLAALNVIQIKNFVKSLANMSFVLYICFRVKDRVREKALITGAVKKST